MIPLAVTCSHCTSFESCFVLAAQSQLEQEMQQQEEQGLLLRGPQLAEFSRLEAEANARTSKTKAMLDPLGTTQRASVLASSCF